MLGCGIWALKDGGLTDAEVGDPTGDTSEPVDVLDSWRCI